MMMMMMMINDEDDDLTIVKFILNEATKAQRGV